jgi:hypothetical protein
MKSKSLLLAITIVLLSACNNQTKVGEAETVTAPEQSEVNTAAAHNEEHAGALTLNKGEKWQADESTHLHVNNLKAKVEAFNKKENKDLNAYHAWAGELQQELEQLVKDCRMKGADHDALHQWLEPVLKDVAALQKATTIEDAKKQADQITASVQQFDQYFK